MLLAGRFLGLGINFAAQVFLVRYLTKADYGVWAYALSIVGFCHILVALGLDKVIDRFVPIYHANRQYDRMFGTILLSFGTILATSTLIIAVFYLFPDFVFDWVRSDAASILFVMLFVIPIDALDNVLIRLFACFASPKAIFFRKHLLGPALKFAVVAVLMWMHGDLLFQAVGYLAASVIGIAVCCLILLRTMRQRGLLGTVTLSSIRVPSGEVSRFAVPLVITDAVDILIIYANVLVLGYFHNADQVAMLKVVLPVATINEIVYSTFSLLYAPGVARLHANKDYAGIRDLYWRTTVWSAVLTFPVFALTFGVAGPLTVFLYGERYAGSGLIMAIVSLGYYFQVLLGLNAHTLRAFGRIRSIVKVNVITAVIAVILHMVLIPLYGAVGAAVATAGSMIAQHALRQVALHVAFGKRLFTRQYLRFYLVIGPAMAALVVVQLLGISSIYIAGLLAAAVSLWVLYLSREFLNIGQTFPEVFKLPLIQWCARMARAR